MVYRAKTLIDRIAKKRPPYANTPIRHPSVKPALTVYLTCLLCFQNAYSETNSTSCASSFIPGEVANYKVTWMGIPLAWSEHTTSSFEENGRKLIRIRMVSRNYKAYSYIYKVNDVTEVVIDPETALPLRLDVIVNEGSIHKSHLTTFYHDKKVAVFQDRISKDIREVPIKSGTQDIFSFLYSARNRDFESLASLKHTLFVDGKLYDLSLKIRKEGRIKLPHHGKVACVQIEPIAEFDGLFLRKGKIFFWVSRQKHRMITCVEARVAVGRVKVKLHEISGTGDAFWDRKE